MNTISLRQDNALSNIPDNSIDLVMSSVVSDINPEIWTQLKRVIKPKGAVLIFTEQPVTFNSSLPLESVRKWGYKGHLIHLFKEPGKCVHNPQIYSPNDPTHYTLDGHLVGDGIEHCIKTYTNEGDTVLDFNGVLSAKTCIRLKRSFIGIEATVRFNTSLEKIWL